MQPVIPEAATKILDLLGIPKQKRDFPNLETYGYDYLHNGSTPPTSKGVLFNRNL